MVVNGFEIILSLSLRELKKKNNKNILCAFISNCDFFELIMRSSEDKSGRRREKKRRMRHLERKN
jgi:hypothetical protein